MNMKITLETLYTPYTLDTYQTFTFDHDTDYILENNESITSDDLEYDTVGFLNALADNLVVLLNKNITDNVIRKIEMDGDPESPRECNFTTDKAWLNFTVDIDALNAYVDANIDDYNANKIKSCDGFIWLGEEEQTRLAYYLNQISEKRYSEEDYYYDQVENVPAYEYITILKHL